MFGDSDDEIPMFVEAPAPAKKKRKLDVSDIKTSDGGSLEATTAKREAEEEAAKRVAEAAARRAMEEASAAEAVAARATAAVALVAIRTAHHRRRTVFVLVNADGHETDHVGG